jgi:hypothetical protein
MADKFYQVFVSSTQADLKDERLLVTNMLAKAGYVAAGMEMFPATDEQQLDYIKRVIDRCDYYVVIVANRYGSVDNEGVSYTEREFEYARSKKIPVLAFLHSDPDSISVGNTDQDPAKAAKLVEFRKKLQTGRVVVFWNNANQLSAEAVIAVTNAVNLTPGIGWIRGDNAIDPKLLQDLERLRSDNAELREQVRQLRTDDVVFDPTMVGPDDATYIIVTIHHQEQTPAGDLDRVGSDEKAITVLLGDLFIEMVNLILTQPNEWQMQK